MYGYLHFRSFNLKFLLYGHTYIDRQTDIRTHASCNAVMLVWGLLFECENNLMSPFTVDLPLNSLHKNLVWWVVTRRISKNHKTVKIGGWLLAKDSTVLYLSCILSACFALWVMRFVHICTCYLNISCGWYSRAATSSFSTSVGVATIESSISLSKYDSLHTFFARATHEQV